MRSFVVSSLSVLTLLSLAACPQPLPAEEGWKPVEGAPATRASATDDQRKEVQRIALEARVKKMRAALISDDEKQCTKDDECELTSFHCCNCTAGGRMAAVSKEKVPDVLKRRGVVCEEYACAQVISDDPSCGATRAVCREGKCVPDVPAAAPGATEGVAVEPIPEVERE